MADFFKQFGGQASTSNKKQDKPSKPVPSSDFFSQFGGSSTSANKIETPAAVSDTPKQEQDAAARTPLTYEQVRETADRPYFSAPLLKSEETTDEEIQAIAQKHKVDPKLLMDVSQYFGAIRPGGSTAEQIESSLARGVGLNIPQLVGKKQLPQELKNAVDDLQDLADQKRSFARGIAENIIPVGLAGKAVGLAGQSLKQIAKQGAKEGAVYGAAAGLGRSKEGEEFFSSLGGAALGAAAGAAIPAALKGAAGKLSRRVEEEVAVPVEKQAVQSYISKNSADLDRGTEEILSSRRSSESDIQNIMLQAREIEPEEATRIATQQTEPDLLVRYLNPSTQEGQMIRAKLDFQDVSNLGVERSINKKLAEEAVLSRAKGFARELDPEASPKDMDEALIVMRTYASRQGEEALQQKYKLYTEELAALDYVKQKAVRAGRGTSFTDKALNALSDAQFVIRDIDENFGTSLEPIHRQLNQAYNRLSFVRNDFRDKITNIFSKNRQIDEQLVKGGKVYEALDTGNIEGLTEPELSAYKDFKELFSEGLKFVNGMSSSNKLDPGIAPLSIPARENYVPHILVPPEELNIRFADVYRKALEDAGRIYGKSLGDLTDLTPREFNLAAVQSFPLRKFLAGLNVFDNREITSGQDAMARFRDLTTSREGQIKMASVAKAAMERAGSVPEWMRETNLYKLADRWISNTLKHLYLRKDIDRMTSVLKRVEAAGGDLEAQYLRNLLQDIQGIRKGTAAEQTMRGLTKYQAAVDNLTLDKGPMGKAVGSVAKALPHVFSDMMRQIYPNLLGMSPRALIMNSTQVFAKTAPELGTKYGYYAIARGALNALLNYDKQVERLVRLGFQPADFVRKYSRPMAEGLRRHSAYAIPNELLGKLGDVSMFLYTKMDTLNRVITLGAADQLAQDLARGSKLAREVLYKMPATVRRQVDAATSQEEISEILASHLNASTQYNYNRISMSEFGRTMGPLFSTFSKWPTATAGELVQEIRSKGLAKGSVRNAEKYLIPLLLLQTMDIGMYGYDPDRPWTENEENKTDRMKKLFGAAGLSQSAPLGSVSGILKGDFFTPPVVDALMKGLVIPSIEQDPDKLIKGIDSSIQNFTPGSVWVRFLTDDLLTLITGERPEGSTFIERSAEGIRRIGQ